MARFGQTCYGFADWEGVNIKGDKGRFSLIDMSTVSALCIMLMLHVLI